MSNKLTVMFSSMCPGITQYLNEVTVLSKVYGLQLVEINTDCINHGICYNNCIRTCIPNPSCVPLISIESQGRRKTMFTSLDSANKYLANR